MDTSKLVRMANQIATFFHHEGESAGAKSTAKHLIEFWDPSMRRGILAHLRMGGEGLNPIALEAVRSLQKETVPAKG
jgi:formate dehydrogenase subunit delta